MASLKETAQQYEAKQTKNIADLERVSVDIELHDGEGTDKEGKTFKYKFAVIDGESYRVPNIVIGQIKQILKESPNCNYVRVQKQGAGIGTTYFVSPVIVEEVVGTQPQ